MILADWLEHFMIYKHFKVGLILSLVTAPFIVIDLLLEGCLYGDAGNPLYVPFYGSSYRRVRKR